MSLPTGRSLPVPDLATTLIDCKQGQLPAVIPRNELHTSQQLAFRRDGSVVARLPQNKSTASMQLAART